MFAFLEISVSLGGFVAVYLLFRVKHLAADYFLQTGWMAAGKGGGDGWLAPLMAHAAVHAIGTASIAILFAPTLWWLGLVDLIVHAGIDRVKASCRCGGKWQPDQTAFWWWHGVDQEAHNLTHLIFIVAIVLEMTAV